MTRPWELELRGGAFDGWSGMTLRTPEPVLVAYLCNPFCEGHATFNVSHPDVPLGRAVSYRRAEVDPDARLAIYEVGETEPDERDARQQRETVGAGASGDLAVARGVLLGLLVMAGVWGGVGASIVGGSL